MSAEIEFYALRTRRLHGTILSVMRWTAMRVRWRHRAALGGK